MGIFLNNSKILFESDVASLHCHFYFLPKLHLSSLLVPSTFSPLCCSKLVSLHLFLSLFKFSRELSRKIILSGNRSRGICFFSECNPIRGIYSKFFLLFLQLHSGSNTENGYFDVEILIDLACAMRIEVVSAV